MCHQHKMNGTQRSKSIKNASQADGLNSEKIKPMALAIVELCWH